MVSMVPSSETNLIKYLRGEETVSGAKAGKNLSLSGNAHSAETQRQLAAQEKAERTQRNGGRPVERAASARRLVENRK